jgi:hypothetical protein
MQKSIIQRTFAVHLHLHCAVIQQDLAANTHGTLQLLVGDPDLVGGLLGAYGGVIREGDLVQVVVNVGRRCVVSCYRDTA